MTGARRLLWATISVLSTFVLFGVSLAAFAFGRGDWVAFFCRLANAFGFLVPGPKAFKAGARYLLARGYR